MSKDFMQEVYTVKKISTGKHSTVFRLSATLTVDDVKVSSSRYLYISNDSLDAFEHYEKIERSLLMQELYPKLQEEFVKKAGEVPNE